MPVRLDPEGKTGPTRGAARGPRWRQVATGWYVPGEIDGTVVEQRILEQSVRLPTSGAVTAWAALRWRGARYFDGMAQGGRLELPVPLVIGGTGNLRPDTRCALSWEQFPPWEREVVDGLPVASIARALFDEVRRRGHRRSGAIAIDMTSAAGLITVADFRAYLELRPAWTGIPLARDAVALAIDDSRSPQESAMRMVWEVDAGLPRPLCNQPVFSLEGTLLGEPDLFDPVAGLVGEYDGADHLREDRRSSDRTREERFRDHGLEYLAVVRGELDRPRLVARRMRSARARARFLPLDRCAWTLDVPAWYAAWARGRG